MLALAQLFREAGAFGYVQLFGVFAGGLWALVCAILLGIRWKVPPLIAVLPLFAVPFVATIGVTIEAYDVEAFLGNVEPARRAAILAAATAEILSQGLLTLLVVPVAAILGLGGLAAGVRAPRAWGMPAGTFLLAGLTALLPLAGLFSHADPVWVVARVLFYGAAVVPLALATANAHPAGNGPEGGMVATAAWASVVGAFELAWLSASWAHGFTALAMVAPESKGAVLTALAEEVSGYGTLAWLTFALAGVPAVLCAFRSGPTLTEEEILAGHANATPMRTLGRVLAVGVWLVWAMAFLALDPSANLALLAGK